MRLFFEAKDLHNDKLYLTPDRFHYLSRVKRIMPGESLSIIIDQKNYLITVISLQPQQIIFKDLTEHSISPQRVNITLIQCLPKQSKMDTIINQCTQLGVHSIYPIESQRSIVKWTSSKKESRISRWQKISQSASEQSQQTYVTQVHPIQTLNKFCHTFNHHSYDICILPWESETAYFLKDCLSTISSCPQPSIAIFIGPEGGISHQEAEQLTQCQFTPVSLGSAIYRTELAGLITISQTLYHFS